MPTPRSSSRSGQISRAGARRRPREPRPRPPALRGRPPAPRRQPRHSGHVIRDLLKLPQRSDKPRQQGITHVLDRGLSVAEVEGLLEVTGDAVDLVKLGWGTALVSTNLKDKLACYREHGIPV